MALLFRDAVPSQAIEFRGRLTPQGREVQQSIPAPTTAPASLSGRPQGLTAQTTTRPGIPAAPASAPSGPTSASDSGGGSSLLQPPPTITPPPSPAPAPIPAKSAPARTASRASSRSVRRPSSRPRGLISVAAGLARSLRGSKTFTVAEVNRGYRKLG